MSATQQLYTAYDVQAVLTTDFTARGVNCVVEVGEWSEEFQRGEPRVMITMGRGKIAEPGGHYQPGAWWPVPNTVSDVARPLLDDVQRYVLTMHAPPPPSTGESMPAAGLRATDQLMRTVLSALRRQLAGPFREAADVEWVSRDELAKRYPSFVYGSLVRVEVVVASPILDDAYTLVEGTETCTAMTLNMNGTITAPETVTEPAS
jgi:hypothetical protein